MAGGDPGETRYSGQHNGDQRAAGAETGDCAGGKEILKITHIYRFQIMSQNSKMLENRFLGVFFPFLSVYCI